MGFLGYGWRLLANTWTNIYRYLRHQPGRPPLAPEFIVFICEYCGRPGEAPRERGEDSSRTGGDFRICGECLARMCGTKQGPARPGDISDEPR